MLLAIEETESVSPTEVIVPTRERILSRLGGVVSAQMEEKVAQDDDLSGANEGFFRATVDPVVDIISLNTHAGRSTSLSGSLSFHVIC